MLWQQREDRTNSEGRIATIDLRSVAGLSGRLLFAEGFIGQRMISVPCTVTRVDRTSIQLTIPEDVAHPSLDSAVILEVAQQTALIQCFTAVKSRDGKGQVTLRRPARPHILQRRRFPRIDIFLGITVRTPDHQVEEVPAQMTNISLDGAACVLVEPVAPGGTIQLNLSAMGLNPPDVVGQVVRCTPSPSHLWVVGLKFNKLLPEQEEYLAEYVTNFTGETAR